MVVFCGLVGLSLSLKQDHDKPASAGPDDNTLITMIGDDRAYLTTRDKKLDGEASIGCCKKETPQFTESELSL